LGTAATLKEEGKLAGVRDLGGEDRREMRMEGYWGRRMRRVKWRWSVRSKGGTTDGRDILV